jgi:tetratricopeptide (TPR) repeat protein
MSRERQMLFLGAGAILLLTLLAYIPAISGGFIWDDDFHITNNRALRDLDGLQRIWTDARTTPQYYPLTHTSFWLQYQLWGANPLPYHIANVLLHIASALLLWGVLAKLRVPGAWLAAAIFALHPVHVESVAWITERKNVLSGFFYMAAAFTYIRHKLDDRDEGWGLPLLALLLFFCALLSKTVTASLPVVLAMVLVWKGIKLRVRDGFFLGTMLTCGAAMGRLTSFLEKYQVGAMGEEWDFSFIERCLIAGRAWFFYPAKLLWPAKLSFVYPRWEIDAGEAWQYLFPLATATVLVTLFMLQKKIGWGPLLALLCYSVTIVPALGFFNVFPMRYSFVADHFQYLASIGPITLLACLLWRHLPKKLRRLAAAILLAACAILTFRQGLAYEGLESLWRHAVRQYDQAFMAHFNLAKILEERGDLEESKLHYLAALAAKPDYHEAAMDLGNILAEQGDIPAAIERYRQSLLIEPEHALTHYNLALLLEQAGRPEEAMLQYMEAIRIEPSLAAAHNNLAIILFNRGDYHGAARELRLAEEHGGEPHPGFVRELADKMRLTEQQP